MFINILFQAARNAAAINTNPVISDSTNSVKETNSQNNTAKENTDCITDETNSPIITTNEKTPPNSTTNEKIYVGDNGDGVIPREPPKETLERDHNRKVHFTLHFTFYSFFIRSATK